MCFGKGQRMTLSSLFLHFWELKDFVCRMFVFLGDCDYPHKLLWFHWQSLLMTHTLISSKGSHEKERLLDLTSLRLRLHTGCLSSGGSILQLFFRLSTLKTDTCRRSASLSALRIILVRLTCMIRFSSSSRLLCTVALLYTRWTGYVPKGSSPAVNKVKKQWLCNTGPGCFVCLLVFLFLFCFVFRFFSLQDQIHINKN